MAAKPEDPDLEAATKFEEAFGELLAAFLHQDRDYEFARYSRAVDLFKRARRWVDAEAERMPPDQVEDFRESFLEHREACDAIVIVKRGEERGSPPLGMRSVKSWILRHASRFTSPLALEAYDDCLNDLWVAHPQMSGEMRKAHAQDQADVKAEAKAKAAAKNW